MLPPIAMAIAAAASLADSERVEEAARILGGINITEAQRQAARDMLADAEQIRTQK